MDYSTFYDVSQASYVVMILDNLLDLLPDAGSNYLLFTGF